MDEGRLVLAESQSIFASEFLARINDCLLPAPIVPAVSGAGGVAVGVNSSEPRSGAPLGTEVGRPAEVLPKSFVYPLSCTPRPLTNHASELSALIFRLPAFALTNRSAVGITVGAWLMLFSSLPELLQELKVLFAEFDTLIADVSEPTSRL